MNTVNPIYLNFRKVLFAWIFLAFASPVLTAAIKLPRWVYTPDQLAEAQAKAKEEGKGLAIVSSDIHSTCPLCDSATSMAFDELKDHAVVIYRSDKNDPNLSTFSPLVVAELVDPKLGRVIPQAVVTSADMDVTWSTLTYDVLKQERGYREVNRKLKAIRKGEVTVERNPDQILRWQLKGRNSGYTGSFVGIDSKGRLEFKDKSGKVYRKPMNVFAESAANFARFLAGQEAASGGAVSDVVYGIEPWTSSDGKVIQAKFVSLGDDKVTLETDKGKSYTLPLSRLSEDSRERARELAE